VNNSSRVGRGDPAGVAREVEGSREELGVEGGAGWDGGEAGSEVEIADSLMFLGFKRVCSWRVQWSSPSLGKSPEQRVNASGFSKALPGR
jgi:hypothetical protein